MFYDGWLSLPAVAKDGFRSSMPINNSKELADPERKK
jgi:hypothetical protein